MNTHISNKLPPCVLHASLSRTDCDSAADLVFVLDESTSIAAESFSDLRKFVYNIVHDIDVGVNHTRVGILTFATIPKIVYKLSQSQTNDDVEDAITCRFTTLTLGRRPGGNGGTAPQNLRWRRPMRPFLPPPIF